MKMSTKHFKRFRAPAMVLVAIGLIAGTFLVTYPVSASTLTDPAHRLRFPYIFLSATISWCGARALFPLSRNRLLASAPSPSPFFPHSFCIFCLHTPFIIQVIWHSSYDPLRCVGTSSYPKS